ncbi:unnamed protein product, partial [Staurois parvus]
SDPPLLNSARDLVPPVLTLACLLDLLSLLPLHPAPASGLFYLSWVYLGAATWFQPAPSPSPPSGALVNKQAGA